MLFRSVLAGLALAAIATVSEAGPFRRFVRPAYQPSYQPVYQPVYQSPAFTPVTMTPAGTVVTSSSAVVTASAEHTSYYTPTVTTTGGFDGDGLAEVNAKRAARGLRPFLRDEGLTQAAQSCAQFRAANGLFGHTSNDFAFVPAGASAASAGCAAYPAGYGWMSCCVYDNYTYAGAAWAAGRDGRRYMHLYVR